MKDKGIDCFAAGFCSLYVTNNVIYSSPHREAPGKKAKSKHITTLKKHITCCQSIFLLLYTRPSKIFWSKLPVEFGSKDEWTPIFSPILAYLTTLRELQNGPISGYESFEMGQFKATRLANGQPSHPNFSVRFGYLDSKKFGLTYYTLH